MAIAVAVVDGIGNNGRPIIWYIYSTTSQPQGSDGRLLDLTPTTPFKIASITKVFTSTMYLWQAGLDGGYSGAFG